MKFSARILILGVLIACLVYLAPGRHGIAGAFYQDPATCQFGCDDTFTTCRTQCNTNYNQCLLANTASYCDTQYGTCFDACANPYTPCLRACYGSAGGGGGCQREQDCGKTRCDEWKIQCTDNYRACLLNQGSSGDDYTYCRNQGGTIDQCCAEERDECRLNCPY